MTMAYFFPSKFKQALHFSDNPLPEQLGQQSTFPYFVVQELPCNLMNGSSLTGLIYVNFL